jgi:hypothetical protein
MTLIGIPVIVGGLALCLLLARWRAKAWDEPCRAFASRLGGSVRRCYLPLLGIAHVVTFQQRGQQARLRVNTEESSEYSEWWMFRLDCKIAAPAATRWLARASGGELAYRPLFFGPWHAGRRRWQPVSGGLPYLTGQFTVLATDPERVRALLTSDLQQHLLKLKAWAAGMSGSPPRFSVAVSVRESALTIEARTFSLGKSARAASGEELLEFQALCEGTQEVTRHELD